MRIHIIGFPHTETTRVYEWCAYTSKARRLATMLHSLGHEVYLYAGQENEAACTEHVAVVDRVWQERFFGADHDTAMFSASWEPDSPHWREFDARCIAAILPRMQPGDYLGITMGRSQKVIADALAPFGVKAVEVGIGYEGVFADFRVWESHAHQSYVHGLQHDPSLRAFDIVIPNSFEEEDFPLGAGDGGYYLFIGRFTARKGVMIAVETVNAIGGRLVMAGQGVERTEVQDDTSRRYIGGPQSDGLVVEAGIGGRITHVGLVGPEERAKLMGGAIACFVPTVYHEPFGGVAVEAMMCGTPVIAQDWGAFTETVQHGVTGFLCLTLAQYVEAAREAPKLDREAIRRYAVNRYATINVRHQYDAYFRQLETLKGKGWYQLPEGDG